MIRNYFLLQCILMLSTYALAQSNFKEGYFINMNGDTTQGFIDLKEWHRNPTSIHYKSKEGETSNMDLIKENVKYFELKGLEAFERHKVSISMDPTTFPHLPVGVDTSKTNEEVFLRVLQRGKNVILYSYTDHVKIRYYLKDISEQTPRELVYKFYYTDSNEKATNTSNVFRNQLKYFASKYQNLTPALTNRIESAFYDRSDLVKIAQAINGREKEPKERNNGSSSSTQFYIGLGINRSTITNTGRNVYTLDKILPPYYTKFVYGNEAKAYSYVPFPSIGLNVYPFPKVKRLLFKSELSFIFVNTQFKKTHLFFDQSITYKHTLKTFMPSISFSANYNVYNKENFKFYLGLGFNWIKRNFCGE